MNLPKSTTCLSSSQTTVIPSSAAQIHLLSVSASVMKKATSLFVRKELNKLELVYKHWWQFLSVSSQLSVSYLTLVMFSDLWGFHFCFFLTEVQRSFVAIKWSQRQKNCNYLIHLTCFSIWLVSLVSTTNMFILLEKVSHWKGHCTYA